MLQIDFRIDSHSFIDHKIYRATISIVRFSCQQWPLRSMQLSPQIRKNKLQFWSGSVVKSLVVCDPILDQSDEDEIYSTGMRS